MPDLGCHQTGKTVHPNFATATATACAQNGVWTGTVVKKDVFDVSVRTDPTNALSQFVNLFRISLYRYVTCSVVQATRNFTTLVYNVSLNVGKLYSK